METCITAHLMQQEALAYECEEDPLTPILLNEGVGSLEGQHVALAGWVTGGLPGRVVVVPEPWGEAHSNGKG